MLKKIRSGLRFFLPILLISFLLFNISENWNQVLVAWNDIKFLPLSISFLIMLLIYVEGALNWHLLLKKINYPLGFKKSFYIFIISNASRYIPGTIWQYIGRIELAKKIGGLSRKITITSLVLEIFILVNAGLIASFFALPFLSSDLKNSYFWVFFIPLSLVFFHPKIASIIVKLIAKLTNEDLGSSVFKLNFKSLIEILPFFVLNFFLNGAALYFLISSLLPGFYGIEYIFFLSGIYAFSWTAGYISLVAPAGLGVSDALLSYLLSTKISLALAAIIALSYRLLLGAAELIIFLIVLKLNPGKDKAEIFQTKKAWEQRSKKFGFKVEGVATKSLPLAINQYLDSWMLNFIEDAVHKKTKLLRNIKILDLGCGYGRLSKPLLEKFRNVKTFGIDISENYVKLYNQDLFPRGKAAEGDIKALPFKDNYFEVVFIVTTLMYLTNPEDQKKSINEIIRVLKPGGEFIIIERSPSGYFFFTLGGLVNLIRGKVNKEIKAVSIGRNSISEMISGSGGELKRVSGVPFLSLALLPLSLIARINEKIVNNSIGFLRILDLRFSKFTFISLYVSYKGTKIVSDDK